MPRFLAVMFTMTTYGTWLRGDRRGWVDRGIILPPEPTLEDYDRQQMNHPPFLFDRPRLLEIGSFIGNLWTRRTREPMYALHVGAWHVHAVVGYAAGRLGAQVKCMKDAVRWGLRPGRTVWSDGYDKRYCPDARSVAQRIAYVQGHNLAAGLPAAPWPFLTPFPPPNA